MFDDRQSYGNNNYEPEYPSYGKEHYKSKDSSSVNLNKVNCINTNININGENTGDVNVGNNGRVAPTAAAATAEDGTEERDVSASSFGGRNNDGETNIGYDYKYQKDKGFVCITNNNNNNGAANEPTPEPPLTCEECFTENLTPEQLANFEEFLANTGLKIKVGNEAITVHSVANLCAEMENDATIPELIVIFAQIGAILFIRA